MRSSRSYWRTLRRWASVGLLLAAIPILPTAAAGPPTTVGRILSAHPHDPRAFTQGLAFADGRLYESTGRYGASSLREVDPESGRVLRQVRLPDVVFGEGLTLWGEDIIQLTWRAGRGLRWRRADFARGEGFRYPGQGWGLTDDGRHWIMSDGSAELRLLDPADGRELRRIEVRDRGRAVGRLNELEWVVGPVAGSRLDGPEVWANIWLQDRVVRIDPADGRVLGYVDLAALWPAAQRPSGEAVLNGIAHDPATGRLFVTGKYWPRLFVIDPGLAAQTPKP
jgi:glutamine cyclotransferase